MRIPQAGQLRRALVQPAVEAGILPTELLPLNWHFKYSKINRSRQAIIAEHGNPRFYRETFSILILNIIPRDSECLRLKKRHHGIINSECIISRASAVSS